MVKNSISNNSLINFLKEHGFLTPSCSNDIYGGLSNSWDIGPNGTELKKKLQTLFWEFFVNRFFNVVSYDGSVLIASSVLESSGHLKSFNDWTVICSNCGHQQRIDNDAELAKLFDPNNIKKLEYKCFNCKLNVSSLPEKANLLVQAFFGEKNKKVFLRPETCQNIFINLPYIQRTAGQRFPFGVAQIGKSFRNEITLHHGIFRTREFSQMELEFFVEEKDKLYWWDFWKKKLTVFFSKILKNIIRSLEKNSVKNKKENAMKTEWRSLTQEELPHYSEKTEDFYYLYSFGWGEMCSYSDRGSYDLQKHFGGSKNKYEGIHNIEISIGVERLFLAALENSLSLKEERSILSLPALLSPYFVAVLFVHKNLKEQAWILYKSLISRNPAFSIAWEDETSIGKAYNKQDSIGTFFCLTVDQKYTDSEIITLRWRDSKMQEFIAKDRIFSFLKKLYNKQRYRFFYEFNR